LPDPKTDVRLPSGERRDSADLERLKRGDETAFQALVQRYYGSMLRVAMGYVRDLELAEDVVQETWITSLRQLHSFRGESSLKTWIFGVLVNIARAKRRKESRILPFASLWSRDDSDRRRPTVDQSRFGADGMWRSRPDSWEGIPESRMIAKETLEQVRSAINRLPPKQREVILLRDVAGLAPDEVGSMLAISEVNQRVRLHRARAAVRKNLEEYLR
jgi:RNA polymerase sigma-70 factor, ECF subfamily